MVQNKAFIYKAIPDGMPQVGKDLVTESTEFDLDAAPPKGGITTKNLWASYDPSQRGRMRDPSIKSYSPAMQLGKPVESVQVIAKVLKSDHEAYKEGDIVQIWSGDTEEYSSLAGDDILVADKIGLAYSTKRTSLTHKVVQLTKPAPGVPLSAYAGVLGMSGMTAYGGLHEVGKPKKGETIWISAAAGAVGQVVGQIAVREGLNVIGSVGEDRKVEYLTKELGFTSAFNYKKEKPEEALKRLAPNGLDIYFDNVGGEQLETAFVHMNVHGRIVACGAVSGYGVKLGQGYGIKTTSVAIAKRLIFQGILVIDENLLRHSKDRDENITKWIQEGSFQSKEHITHGMDKAAEGLVGMLKGENLGKAILKISDESRSDEE